MVVSDGRNLDLVCHHFDPRRGCVRMTALIEVVVIMPQICLYYQCEYVVVLL